MAKQKIVKCRYSHCEHSSRELPREEAVQIGKTFMHKDCAKKSQLIIDIRDFYYEHISNTVVMKNLVAVINNIVFKKHVDPEYLLYVLHYANDNRLEIKSPYSLHYLIDNARIKKSWNKKNEEKAIRKATHMANVEDDNIKMPDKHFVTQQPCKSGFTGIFGR